MTVSNTPYDPRYAAWRRDEWIAIVGGLINEISEWAKAEQWVTELRSKTITERDLGAYSASELLIKLPAGELIVTPIGLNPMAGSGRVDIEAIPTLNRVRLIFISPDAGWRVMTDSNVPLRIAWNRESFKQLAEDLLA